MTSLRLIATWAVAAISLAMPATASEWITAPAAAIADKAQQPIALQFRREVNLPRVPATLRVKISADQRYVLYVNGKHVAAGPSRGDLKAWREVEVDLAPHLHRGVNVIASEVWNDARYDPLAQITSGTTAFRLAAQDPRQAALVDSGSDWIVRVDASRIVTGGVAQIVKQLGSAFYGAGAPETIDAAQQSTDWAAARSKAIGWEPVTKAFDGPPPYRMVDDALPQMRRDPVSSGRVVRANGVKGGAFPHGPVTIAANTEATLLVDSGRVLAAYPVLHVSGGKGATVTLTYTEALYDPAAKRGGPNGSRGRFADRSRVADGEALGLTDTFKPDGTSGRRLAPFWWRAWRFVEVRVKTGDQPLTLDRLETLETGYPFAQRGRFVSDDPQLNEIWRIGWQTALLDAHETYMDTAYWEQLQYIGDTRIQMLLSYDVSGDPRLAVQALDAFNSSRQVDGLPQAAWPASNKNLIPPFALLWIGTLHDFWMRQPDTAVLTRNLEGMRAVLDWYAPYLREDGIVKPTPGWPFIDWRPHLDGMATRNGKGPDDCIITLMYYGALREAADIEGAVGDSALKQKDIAQAVRVREGLLSQCWVAERGLFADTPAKDRFSQHANVLAVLYDLVPKDQQKAVLEKVTLPSGGIDAPDGITGTTYYFSFYLARALDHAGMAGRYVSMLSTWRRMLAQGFTTWPENPDPSRSDTHAWSAHPTSGLLNYVAGIQPAAPGFARVRIAPQLGKLKRLDAAMAHPAGLIETRYEMRNGRLSAVITLPKSLSGEFVWQGRPVQLRGGKNRVAF